ncbi:mannose-6-phosphate isomerase [Candidatus Pacearchaeota archaeon]|nr:mannose-6-phosphate isomerase [Candidatus Pacearchaeota archaeon]
MVKSVKKPWGGEKHFIHNELSTVKILIVKPFQILSLQKHRKRKEVWHFLTDGWVQLGKREKKMKKGDTITIQKMQAHRIFSKGKKVEVLEVSLGHFDQNDEIRLEDKYGRR